MTALADPIVIAHRGHPATLPDHTLEGYTRAVERGADFLEPDLVSTKDHVLVARHENEIGGTTDAAVKFPDRKATKVVDGQSVTGWFVEDFTLAELRTLRARQPLADLRPTDHDGRYLVPTFDEILELRAALSARLGRPVGVYPETKHPSYFDGLGLSLEEPLLEALARHGLTKRTDPVFVQSFERANLQELRTRTAVRLVQLVWTEAGPWDQRATGLTYAQMLTREGLATVATYADGIGPAKTQVIPVVDGRLGQPTSLVTDAHAAGLVVHPYTFRPEARYRPTDLDPVAEVRAYLAAGVDGVFCDRAEDGVAAR